ncbi:50S ribosomal protein L18 [Candidatus Hepatoplasma crinochetorum Av]|jgi:large subunit ribosomal protein L18|uniref:Large ribosomal subunit protein uL18 n=1 Tax=Candidatus Hepatoplasma crinochetorum Av TaxID=1427984 RepID=W8GFF1_9MOLU|nr:50S ribosomal protein L18 [Candidatus Hepatoplasma crinochetorum]AHK22499.1 50S ribosomal protein L18 [Candidatus Hepatoplasma crinochetorum Av]
MAKNKKIESRNKRKLRVRKKIFGTDKIPRLSVYKSNKNISAQLIDDLSGKTLASSSTIILKLDANNIENAFKVGQDIAKKAKDLKIERIVFDRNGYIYHGKIKALADGVRKENIKI